MLGAPRRTRWLWAAAFVAAGLLVGAARDFITIVRQPRPDSAAADGIAVFSGGSSRVSAGLDLLRRAWAPRLVIAGGDDVRMFQSDSPDLLACCVDLHPGSRNTAEDAAAIVAWAQEHRMSTVLAVTTDVHMPRALLELRAAGPGLRVVPYPVEASADVDGVERCLAVLREFAKWSVVRGRRLLRT